MCVHTTGIIVPARVWILYSAAFFPSRSARNLAMQRIPLPHISGCERWERGGRFGGTSRRSQKNKDWDRPRKVEITMYLLLMLYTQFAHALKGTAQHTKIGAVWRSCRERYCRIALLATSASSRPQLGAGVAHKDNSSTIVRKEDKRSKKTVLNLPRYIQRVHIPPCMRLTDTINIIS